MKSNIIPLASKWTAEQRDQAAARRIVRRLRELDRLAVFFGQCGLNRQVEGVADPRARIERESTS